VRGFINYSSTIASLGQTSAQLPHSVQTSLLITKYSSPSEIAPLGHSSIQIPHDKQASVILYTIVTPFHLEQKPMGNWLKLNPLFYQK